MICQHFHLCGSESKCCQNRCEYARILNVTTAVWWQGFLLPSGPGALKCHSCFLTTSSHCEASKCQPLCLPRLWKRQVLRGMLQVERKGQDELNPPPFASNFSLVCWHSTKLLPPCFQVFHICKNYHRDRVTYQLKMKQVKPHWTSGQAKILALLGGPLVSSVTIQFGPKCLHV